MLVCSSVTKLTRRQGNNKQEQHFASEDTEAQKVVPERQRVSS